MKIQKIILVLMLTGFMVGLVWAGDNNRRRGRQPEYESYKTERYIETRRSGGRGNQGQVSIVEETIIHRKYKKNSNRRTKQRCTDEKGRRKSCN